MQKNDVIELTITDLGVDGAGIGKYEGMAFFVKDTVIGDVITAKIMKLKKHYGYARLMELKEASPNRVEPRCVYAKSCGGCQLQQMSYESQLAFKEKKIKDNLIRLGGFTEKEVELVMEPIVGMEHPFGYRNKAQFPVGYDREGNVVTGFYAGRTHSIIPNTECALGVPENREILEAVLSYMREQNVSAYEEVTGRGLIRHILTRFGFDSGEIMVCLVINGKKLPREEKLLEKLTVLPGMKSISVNVNRENTNVILGEETRAIWGKDTIKDALYLRDTRDFSRTEKKTVYQISPQSFYQVNPLQTEKLYSLVMEYAGLTGEETVWDLYCGIGTISLFLAAHAKRVFGVEIVPKAVEDARENARLNGIRNAEFFVGKAEVVLPEFYERERDAGVDEDMMHPDVMVVDPPRKGCDEECLGTMIKMRPERIVYVSCDSATLARDLRVLRDGGYEVRRVRGVDQFGETVHVEVVCLLSKLHAKQKIEVELTMSEMDLTAAESKVTYEEIKGYVLEHTGLKVSNLYIAQVKQKCGIIERENYNLPKSENSRQPKCPPEKEKAIREALEYFRMI
ncbi:MAG: 23S rRNA (uracil(1939)-C(5))-methyltransferase RlmD [Roseburia sp.]|nr:23S rRNA (uracil(1939)-C(5))-methyltransferase RlmD [Roseburia sp.]